MFYLFILYRNVSGNAIKEGGVCVENLLGKITLYDFVAMIIPGLLVTLSYVSIYAKEFYHFYKDIGNSFVSGILILVVSYCVGWIVSEIGNIIFSNKNKSTKDVNTNIQPDLLEKYKEALETYLENTVNMNDIEKYGDMANALIQSDSKYSRIHNYNSSKSFSKNLGSACLFIVFAMIIHIIICLVYLCNKIKIPYYLFVKISACIILIIFCVFGYKVMKKRFQSFSSKVNIYICTYFIDYVKHMEIENSNEENKCINNVAVEINHSNKEERK